MIDPEFDPYELLVVHQDELARQHDVINQLIAANNNLQTTMLELTQQHQRLVNLNSVLRQEIESQKLAVNLLKTRAQI